MWEITWYIKNWLFLTLIWVVSNYFSTFKLFSLDGYFQVHLRGYSEESIIWVFTMTQTIWQMIRDWNWLQETRSRKLSSGSDRKKMSRYNFHTNWMSNCQSLSDLSSFMRLGLDNSRNLTTTKRRGERERVTGGGCVSSVYSRGRTSTDQEPEKHLIYDLGLVLFGDRDKLKGDCERGGSLRPWGENRECGQCLMGTGC